MSFENPSFETSHDHAGCAQGWLFACTSQTEYASFDEQPAETFEDGWPGLLMTDLEAVAVAVFGAASVAVESFEKEWSNEAFLVDFAGIAASFDVTPEAVEDFEEGWSTNENYETEYAGVGTDLTAASFDAEAVEDFEEQWDSNESYEYSFVGVGTDLTAASFDTTTPEAVEDFEEEWAMPMATI